MSSPDGTWPGSRTNGVETDSCGVCVARLRDRALDDVGAVDVGALAEERHRGAVDAELDARTVDLLVGEAEAALVLREAAVDSHGPLLPGFVGGRNVV